MNMFDDYFEVYLADNEQAKRIHYNTRYQVYCEEMGFENKANFVEKCEIDHWDNHSVHFIVKMKGTDHWVGAMRLVLPVKDKLPLSEHCQLDEVILNNDLFQAIEVSRLCVIKEIRRRKTDGDPPMGLSTEGHGALEHDNAFFIRNQRRMKQSIIWGLFRAASIYSKEQHIDNWYFLTTKALARIIKRENFKLHPAGNSCQLNGERFPFRINLDEILANPLWSQGYNVGYKLYSQLDKADLAKCA